MSDARVHWECVVAAFAGDRDVSGGGRARFPDGALKAGDRLFAAFSGGRLLVGVGPVAVADLVASGAGEQHVGIAEDPIVGWAVIGAAQPEVWGPAAMLARSRAQERTRPGAWASACRQGAEPARLGRSPAARLAAAVAGSADGARLLELAQCLQQEQFLAAARPAVFGTLPGLRVGRTFYAVAGPDGIRVRLPSGPFLARLDSGEASPFRGAGRRPSRTWLVLVDCSPDVVLQALREARAHAAEPLSAMSRPRS